MSVLLLITSQPVVTIAVFTRRIGVKKMENPNNRTHIIYEKLVTQKFIRNFNGTAPCILHFCHRL